MPAITSYDVTSATAKAFRALNKYGMNLADFAGQTSGSVYAGFGNGTGYTVTNWISDGVFANLAAVQAVYPVCQSGSDTVDWVLLQSAVDFLIYGSLGTSNFKTTKRKLIIPAGLYNLNRTLNVGYGTVGTPPLNLNGNGYVSITIEGEGPQYDSTGNGMTGTTIFCNFTNGPGIAVNRNVQTIFRGFLLKGAYTYVVSNFGGILNSAASANIATYKDPALPSDNWIGGNAVNVGIAYEPYTSAASAAAYPARVLPSYFGGGTSSAQMGSVGGSDFLIEDVNITQFVIGIGRPYGDQNSEFVRIQRGQISYCPYAITIGHSQCRNVAFRDMNIFAFHTAFTNEGGTQTNGNLHGTYDNIHASYGYQLFNNTNSWTGCSQFTNCYMEGIWRGATSGGEPMSFDNCFFSFYDAQGIGLSPTSHFSGSNILLKNCTIYARNGVIMPQRGNDPIGVELVNCSVQTWIAPTLSGNAALSIFYMNGTFGTSGSGARRVNNVTVNPGSGIDVQTYNGVYYLRRGLTHAGLDSIDYTPNAANFINGPYGSTTLMGGFYRFQVPKIGVRNGSTGTMASRTGYDMVFPRAQFGTIKADIGDVFFVQGTGNLEYVCVVVAISGGNMTLRQLNGYYSANSTDYQTDGNAQLTAGNAYSASYVCTRVRYNPGLVLGSVTSGSAVISNVKAGFGSGNAVSTGELEMAAGDYFIHSEPERLNVGGSPNVPINLVTNVNTAAQTITLTNNFNVTNACYPVVFYIKVFNA